MHGSTRAGHRLATYHYTIGPHIGAPGSDSYLHETLLESFGAKAPKEIWADLQRMYSAQPGTVLGKYVIRRIRKTNGTLFVRKTKQP